MQSINADQFFSQGLAAISANFSELHTLATTLRASDNNSGMSAPLLMEMGADNQHWVLPEGVAGPYLVLDHGFFLNANQYSEVDGEIVLNYEPSVPYAITIMWSASKSGLTRPQTLTQHDSLGSRYWLLPLGYGANVLVYDQGRILDRDSYHIENNMVVLHYTPQLPIDISASWGMGGPGISAPKYLDRSNPSDPLDLTHFRIPKNASGTLMVTDHGLALDAVDFSIDADAGVLTLNYVPTEPIKVAAGWGFNMDGLYMSAVATLQAPDGVRTEFVLDQEPQVDSILLREIRQDGTIVHHDLYEDFTVEGRVLTFINGVVPEADASLVAGLMTSVFTSQSQLTSSGDVVLDPAVYLETNTYTEEYTHNTDGSLASVTFKDSGTVVKTVTYTYTAEGRVATKVEVGAGKTITRTYNYDSNGKLLSVTKTVV